MSNDNTYAIVRSTIKHHAAVPGDDGECITADVTICRGMYRTRTYRTLWYCQTRHTPSGVDGYEAKR